jgi:putative iron-only hydrogenase system regulator
MDKRMGVLALEIQRSGDNVSRVNKIISDFNELVIGRLGVPYRERSVSVIALIVEGTTDECGAFSGKLGMIDGVRSKVLLFGAAAKRQEAQGS